MIATEEQTVHPQFNFIAPIQIAPIEVATAKEGATVHPFWSTPAPFNAR